MMSLCLHETQSIIQHVEILNHFYTEDKNEDKIMKCVSHRIYRKHGAILRSILFLTSHEVMSVSNNLLKEATESCVVAFLTVIYKNTAARAPNRIR